MIKFLTKAQHVVQIDQFSSVTIRAKMDFKTTAKVQNDMLNISLADGGEMKASGILAQKLSLLKHNILSWDGPMFIGDDGKPVKFSPDVLDSLDPVESEGFITLIFDTIAKLNRGKEEAAPDGSEDNPLLGEPATSKA